MTGTTFKNIRSFYGVSAREMAASLQISVKTVYNWESLATVPALADEYMQRVLEAMKRAQHGLGFLVCKVMERGVTSPFIPSPETREDMFFFFPEVCGRDMELSVFLRAAGEICALRSLEAATLKISDYHAWKSEKNGGREEYLLALMAGEAK